LDRAGAKKNHPELPDRGEGNGVKVHHHGVKGKMAHC